MNHSALDQSALLRAFNRSQLSYNQHAFVQQEVADRLLDRVAWLKVKPQLILDCSAHSACLDQGLLSRFPGVAIQHFDLAAQCSVKGQSQFSTPPADLLIANLSLHWQASARACLQQWHELLKPGGLLLMTTLGPDTLHELRQSFSAVSDYPHVHEFRDMHDVGDDLLATGFVDPVMEREELHIDYDSLDVLLHDIKASGAANASHSRLKGLMGKQRWQAMRQHYVELMREAEPERRGETVTARCEVIYGLAWRSSTLSQAKGQSSDEVLVPVPGIKR